MSAAAPISADIAAMSFEDALAGFDVHKADPLAQLQVEIADFVWLTEELLGVLRRHSNGRLVSILEGGYDLQALAASATAHVGAFMND